MSKAAEVIILGEDQAHIGSVYRAITSHLDVPVGRVRKLPAPAGRGDAAKYVLDNLPKEAKSLLSGPASARLIVCLDADSKTAEERRRQIDSRLAEAGLPNQRQRESIVRVVPQRNIETWLHFGRCEEVDEDTDYKRTTGGRSTWKSEDYKCVGEMLGKTRIPKENPPASLDEARSELRHGARST